MVLMAVNMRGRVPGLELESDLAGNYEIGMPFLAEDIDAAWKVRLALGANRLGRLSSRSLPSFCEAASWSCGLSLVTNWSTFYHDLHLPSSSLIRHMPAPVQDTSILLMCIYIIFSPREGEIEYCARVWNPNTRQVRQDYQ